MSVFSPVCPTLSKFLSLEQGDIKISQLWHIFVFLGKEVAYLIYFSNLN